MTISDAATTSKIVSGATSISVAQFFTVGATGNPAYLVVNALDRNEYTAAATRTTGSFSGNGHVLNLANEDGDGRGAGIVFTLSSTGQYVNATYGSLSALTFMSSSSSNDMTNISLFGASSASLAQAYASDAYGLMQGDRAGYIGSATVVTDKAHAANVVPAAATPDGIATVAESFVGDAWNMDGCWVLASTIAAEAGASLPVQSTAIGVPGAANGEWYVAYNGPSGSSGNWQNLVSTGDIVAFAPAGGGGHITTCVSGSGSSALLVDNITYEGGNGQISNPANDGSPDDIIIAAPHSAAQEFNGANASDVVVYALDTPVVKTSASVAATVGTPLALSGTVSATDPEGHAITQYQLYDSASGASFVVANASHAAASAATALTVTSLASVSLSLANAGSSTIEIRASNGSYWGDWQGQGVTAAPPTPVAPKLGTPTANQIWQQGSKVSLTLPSTLFTDPQKLALTYTATGGGSTATTKAGAFPSWLSFNPTTRTFTGTVPTGALLTVPITVTATDTAGLSASESFVATVPAAAPTLAIAETTQSWAAGSKIADALPANSFIDPQKQALTLQATLSTGAALPSWLVFSAATGTFSGTAPTTAQSLTLKVTATDTSGLSASETFTASVIKSAHGLTLPALTLADWGGAAQTQAAVSAPVRASGFGVAEIAHSVVGFFPGFHHHG